MNEIDKAVGAKAKVERERAGLSLRDLAAAMPGVPGTDPSAMCEREQGVRPWTVVQLCAAAAAYGVSPASLLPVCEVPPDRGTTCAEPQAPAAKRTRSRRAPATP